MRSEQPTRATLALAILCVAIGVGALYGSPVFRAAAARELGWSSSAAAGAFALGYLAVIPVPLLVGFLADRLGIRVVMVAGSAISALALFGAAATDELWQWYVSGGIALTLGYYTTFVGVNLLASTAGKRGTSLGLVLGVGYGSGLTVGQLLAQVLVDGLGWRVALAAEGLLAIVVALAAARGFPSKLARSSAAASDVATGRQPLGRVALLGGFFVGNVLLALYDESVYQHGYAFGSSLGLSGTAAAAMISAASAALTIGLIVGGSLSDRVGRRPVLVVSALGAAGTLLGFVNSSAPALWLWGAAFGLFLGASIAVRSAAWADAFAGPRLGRSIGIVAAGYPTGAAIATYGGAVWLEAGGSFEALYIAAAAAAILWAIVGAALTRPRPQLQETPSAPRNAATRSSSRSRRLRVAPSG